MYSGSKNDQEIIEEKLVVVFIISEKIRLIIS
jgi:hypothetical protein